MTTESGEGDDGMRCSELEAQLAQRTRELEGKTSELAAATSELGEVRAKLMAQERLAGLGALMAGIAHEIKNPLNFIINFAELSSSLVADLRENLAGDKAPSKQVLDDLADALEVLAQNLTKISQHGSRANSIVNGMLLTSRGGALKLERADFNLVVSEGLELGYHGYRGKAPGFNPTIDIVCDASAGIAELAPTEFARVLINLVNNACDAMREKQRTAGVGYTPTLVVRTRGDASEVEVRIRDNGTGIDQGIVRKVWSPFFTTKPVGEGTGLGLSISYETIVKKHQGTIEIDTAPGEFTEFVIRLPRCHAPSSTSAGRSAMFAKHDGDG